MRIGANSRMVAKCEPRGLIIGEHPKEEQKRGYYQEIKDKVFDSL